MISIRRIISSCLGGILFCFVLSAGVPDAGMIPATGSAEVFFSPNGGATEAVLDKSQRSERYTAATFLMNADIAVVIDDRHAIAHNKIIIIDRSSLITGSFNFSKNADQNNAENLLILKGNKPLLDRYLANYQAHRGHSVSYEFAPKNRKSREG